MSWTYRIFKTQYKIPVRGKEPYLEDCFTIREVYYDDLSGRITGISGIDGTGVYPSGTTLDDLWKDLSKMQAALNKPPLTAKDIPNYEYNFLEARDSGDTRNPKE